MMTHHWEILVLQATNQLYFQIWHLPATTLNAILTGALIESALESFIWVHLMTVAGVAGTYTLSMLFLASTVNASEFLKSKVLSIDRKFEGDGVLSSIMTMSSLRVMPGAPNLVYNLVLPHIKSIKMWQVLAGSLFGQAPLDYCFTKAG